MSANAKNANAAVLPAIMFAFTLAVAVVAVPQLALAEHPVYYSALTASQTAPIVSASNPVAPQGVHAVRSGAHAVRVRWKSVADAKSYVVYRWNEEGLRWKKAAVLPAGATTWRDKRRMPDVTYRYAVAACARKKGGSPGAKSYWVEARAYSKGAKRVNPGKIDLGASVVALKVGDEFKLTAYVNSSSYGKKIGAGGCQATEGVMRLVTSNAMVVPYDGSGTVICASRTGACEVRVLAPNGNLSAPVRVEVSGHEFPGEFSEPVGDARYERYGPKIYDPELVDYLNDRASEVHAITEDLYAGWTEHSSWSATREADGSLRFPDWMDGATRKRVSSLFEDDRFSDAFRLASISFGGLSGGGTGFTLHFYSAVLDSVPGSDCEYRVSGPTERNAGSRMADGWWLEWPEAFAY